MKLALAIERIFWPSNVYVITGLLFIYYLGANSPYVNNLIAFFFSLIVYFLFVFVLKKFTKDENHIYLYSAFISIIVFFFLSFFLFISKEFLIAVISLLIIIILSNIIRPRWKISMHTMMLTASVTILSIFDLNSVVGFIFLPIVGWSRLKLRKHTISQVLVGALVGFIMPIIIFNLKLI